MRNLSKVDQIRADREIAKFMRGEAKLLELPSWMVVGKRCQHRNIMGQCNDAVMTDGPYCYYHQHFDRKFTEIQAEKAR